jgi:hypothetical protein
MVQVLCQKRRIAFSVVGHRYVLKRDDLDAFLESMKRPALGEIDSGGIDSVK